MIDPTRLLDGDGDDFERRLLGAALEDSGSPAARSRALAVFAGAGASVMAATSVAQASVAAAPTSAVAASVPKLTAGALLKWIGTGVVVGTLSAGGIHAVVSSHASSPMQVLEPPLAHPTVLAAPHAVPRVDAPPAVVEVPAPVATTPEPNARLVAPPANASGAEVSVPSNAAFPTERPGPHLRDELLALERARHALRSGDAAAALSALASYESRFPEGALSREATVLAVEARLAAGDQQGARAVAARARETDSTSPHAKKIETLLSARKKP
jgi:hypothetical protein